MLRRDFLRGAAITGIAATNLFSFAYADDNSKRSVPTVVSRGSYANSKDVFEKTKRGRVVFLGGSITEMNGHRPIVCEYLQKRFPETEFEFVNAGIASTCSDVGAFRLEEEVLADKPLDLLFVEFAVNDDQDGEAPKEHAIRGMEGIVRHVRKARPNADIQMTFFANEHLIAEHRAGKIATSIAAHTLVAERYDISTSDVAKALQLEIDSGGMTWEEYGGVHPAPRGAKFAADLIVQALEDAWKRDDKPAPHPMPAPVSKRSYSNAGWRGFDNIQTNDGKDARNVKPEEKGFGVYIPEWEKLPGQFRSNFANKPFLCATQPGSEATFEFEGNAVAIYILAGPDAGVVEYSVDGKPFKTFDTHHYFSSGLHYPYAITLDDELEVGKHTATLRLVKRPPNTKGGDALRILQIAVNRDSK